MQPLYGLIGITLTHSFSPAYFKKKFAEQNIDAFYEAFDIKQGDKLYRDPKSRAQIW